MARLTTTGQSFIPIKGKPVELYRILRRLKVSALRLTQVFCKKSRNSPLPLNQYFISRLHLLPRPPRRNDSRYPLKIDRAGLPRYGLTMADRQEVMKTVIGAKAAAESIETEGPVQIGWDQTCRRIVAKINITGRETDSVVADIRWWPASRLRGLFLLNPGVVHRPAAGLTIVRQRHNF